MSKAKRLVGIVFAVLFAVSAFGCAARPAPTPTDAGQSQQSGSLLKDGFELTEADNELSAYLFVYFVGDGGSYDNEQMYFSVSSNGFSWEPLNGGTPILRSTVGERGIRDPHIVRKHDGTGFYIIATDLSIDHGHEYSDNPYRVGGNNAWGTSQTEGSRAIIVWESEDLVHWGESRRCVIARDNATCTWAPESIWDEEKQAYMVFWSSKTSEDWNQRVYRCYTEDFVTFTAPEVYIERNESYIDTSFIQDGEWYYRFTKNEATGKYIIMEKSKSLSGPFTAVNTFSINGIPGMDYTRDGFKEGTYESTGFEGPTGFKMNGEDKWFLLLDGLNNGKLNKQGYVPFITDNLAEGTFVSASTFDFGGGKQFRHGSCIPITGVEYWGLLEAYGNEPDATSNDDPIFSLDFEDNLTASGSLSGATAEARGNITYVDGYNGKAAKVSGTKNYIELTGTNPLKGRTEATISFAAKVNAKSWILYAAPSAGAPNYNNEQYLGMIWGDEGHEAVYVQRWSNSGTRAATANAEPIAEGEWHHFTISFYEGKTVIYVDGRRWGGANANKTLGALLGNSPITYLGKATWGSGEYSDFLIDSFKVYDYAMNRYQAANLYTAEKAA